MPINNDWIKVGALVAALAVVLGGLDWHQFAPASSGQCSTDLAAAQPVSYTHLTLPTKA